MTWLDNSSHRLFLVTMYVHDVHPLKEGGLASGDCDSCGDGDGDGTGNGAGCGGGDGGGLATTTLPLQNPQESLQLVLINPSNLGFWHSPAASHDAQLMSLSKHPLGAYRGGFAP
jgi:hypothetical protein